MTPQSVGIIIIDGQYDSGVAPMATYNDQYQLGDPNMLKAMTETHGNCNTGYTQAQGLK